MRVLSGRPFWRPSRGLCAEVYTDEAYTDEAYTDEVYTDEGVRE